MMAGPWALVRSQNARHFPEKVTSLTLSSGAIFYVLRFFNYLAHSVANFDIIYIYTCRVVSLDDKKFYHYVGKLKCCSFQSYSLYARHNLTLCQHVIKQ